MALLQHAQGGKPWANGLDDPSLVDDGVCLEEILSLVGAGEPQPGDCGGVRGHDEHQLRGGLNSQQGGVETPYVCEHVHTLLPGDGGGHPGQKEGGQTHTRLGRVVKRGGWTSDAGNSSGHDSASGAAPSRCVHCPWPYSDAFGGEYFSKGLPRDQKQRTLFGARRRQTREPQEDVTDERRRCAPDVQGSYEVS